MSEVVHLAIAEPHHLAPVWIATLDDARPEIETKASGSRTYLAGIVAAAGSDAEDVGRSLLGLVEHLTVWVEYRGSYVRVQSVDLGDWRLRIRCSQAADVGLAFLDGQETALRVVEPSPPRPTDEWFPAERARAIRDLVGDARPTVQVPTPDGKERIAFDPWAPEFMQESGR
ncbi:hypothetical protein AB0L97_32845 [Nocardia sp. NPDC051911]|uniref:hypothetical protein n=1 Tax=Nocardia sp. NPDC051911 TaxID=3154648 RepID=UPI00344A93E1